VGARHNVICGAGYRQIDDHFFGSFSLSLDPEYRNTNLFSAFIQDEITLSEDLWYLIVGGKWLHNDFSGPEYQPTVRLLCTPNERETIWAAVSRAVRTPNRIEDDFTFNQFVGFPPPLGFPTYAQIVGNRALESEDLLSFELGYRAQPTEFFSWDLATFYNNYTDLAAVVPAGAPFFDPTLGSIVAPQTMANVLGADTYGAELASAYEIMPDWRLHGAYTLLYMDVHAGPTDLAEGSSPHNQANIRSSWDLRPDLDLDVITRYVDNLPALGISSYVAMDVRLGWRPWDNLEWAIVGRNLLDDRHAEFSDAFSGIIATEVQSEMYSTLTWTY
jgi:iron complex outermembrane receptor protein